MSNVFLSWSGDSSKRAAQVLHTWLPTVIQTAHPYMSAADIDKGERWSVDIAKQLEDTHFGIICMTPENISAPWILFEAGALSKSVERSRVSPLLFGLSPSDFTKSPLLQFQFTLFTKDDVLKLLQSINNASSETEKLSDVVLQTIFERSWPDLESGVNAITFNATGTSGRPYDAIKDVDPTKTGAILEELLSLGRSQMNILRSPEELLPPPYLQFIMRAAVASTIPLSHQLWARLRERIDAIAKLMEHLPSDERDAASILINEINKYVRYIRQRSGRTTFVEVPENVGRYAVRVGRDFPINEPSTPKPDIA